MAAILSAKQDETLDVVELGTGRRLVRPLLKGVSVRDGSVVSLRLQPEGEAKTTTVLLKAITKIVAEVIGPRALVGSRDLNHTRDREVP